MEALSSMASTPNVAQDVQTLREALIVKDDIEQKETQLSIATESRELDRSVRNRMSDEIVSILSDAMSIMKKTGEEARNSGR